MQPHPAATVKDDGLGEGITKPLAEKVTEYILDHQDDATQEDRWRTIVARDSDQPHGSTTLTHRTLVPTRQPDAS